VSQRVIFQGLAVLLALMLCRVVVEGQEPEALDVSGTWALEVILLDGDVFAGTLSLQQEGDLIDGTWQHDGAGEKPRVRGEIKGRAITFYWYLNIPARSDGADGAVKLSFEGALAGDTMTGTVSFGHRAEDLDWTARRAR